MQRIRSVIDGTIRSPLLDQFRTLHDHEPEPLTILLQTARQKGYISECRGGIYLVFVTQESVWEEIKYLLAINNTYWWEHYGGEVGRFLKTWRKENEKKIKKDGFYFQSIDEMASFDPLCKKFDREYLSNQIGGFKECVHSNLKRHTLDLIAIGTAKNLGKRLAGGYLNSRGYPTTFAMMKFHNALVMTFYPIPNEKHPKSQETELREAYLSKFEDPPPWDQKKKE